MTTITLLRGNAAIKSAITATAQTQKDVDNSIDQILKSVIVHAHLHGDCGVATRAVTEMFRDGSARQKAAKKFVETFAPVKWSKNKKANTEGYILVKERRMSLQGETPEQRYEFVTGAASIVTCLDTFWLDFKEAEADPKDLTDSDKKTAAYKKVESFFKSIHKAMEDGKIIVSPDLEAAIESVWEQ
ncbi:UNVERIFIED_CONTAM: hypothetical protein RF648_20210, partial [Kocuria sp. CPCC 205274]